MKNLGIKLNNHLHKYYIIWKKNQDIYDWFAKLSVISQDGEIRMFYPWTFH